MTNQELLLKIKSLVDEVNAECFGNQLNMGHIKIRLSRSGKDAGSVSFNQSFLFVNTLSISQCFVWTETDLRNVIAHELIHIFEAQVLKSKPGHGANFQNKLRQINQNPKYSVSTYHSMKSTKVKKDKKIPFLLSQDQKKLIFPSTTLLQSVSKESLERSLGKDFIQGEVDSSKVVGFKTFRRLGRFYRVSEQRVSELGLPIQRVVA